VIGIGDGGNEVGMGGIREGLLRVVPDLAPGLCVVPAEECLACDVSNWGAYALVRMMESAACREDLLPSPEEEGRMLAAMARVGAVDGTTKRPGLSVDGFPAEVLEGVLLGLRAARGGMKFPLPGPLVPS
jgi:hypothetical protein